MLSKIRGQVDYLRRHPAYRGPSTIGRLVAWEARAATNRPAMVPFAGGKFYCPPERRGMAKLAYIFGDRYESEIAHLGQVVKPGMAVLDIGAHYGTYTLPLSRLVGETGTVVAVEPAAATFSVLERNIALNQLGNVRAIRAAVADEPGEVTLYVHPDPSRTGMTEGAESLRAEKVPAVTLDDVADEIGRPIGYIKIDIEGHEVAAFRGASRVLEQDRPVVQFEMVPGGVEGAGSPQEYLAGLGYTFSTLEDGVLTPLADGQVTGHANIFAFPA